MTVLDFPLNTRGLADDERDLLRECLDVWAQKRRKNLLLTTYYDSHQAFKNLGISIPPSMRYVNAALGWPSRAVQSLARKHRFEGFSVAGQQDPFDTGELLADNHFDVELAQAINSAYKHSVAWLAVSHGGDGEPDVLVNAMDAESCAAVWDNRRRHIKAAAAVTETDDEGSPVEAILFLPRVTIYLQKSEGRWVGERRAHSSARPLVEPLIYDPQLNRPFGRSRITREVRYLTDAAIRTMVRAETTAEFFAAPQRYVLDAAEDAFADMDKWSAIIGRVLALSAGESGNVPTVGQFPQTSMTPHWEMYRQLGQNFCAATGLPQSAVGLFADNPASAEAMQAAEAQLSDEGEYQWRIFRPALRRTLQNIVMLRDGGAPQPEIMRTTVNWTPTRYVSPQAASDWAVKAVGADETLKGTTVIKRRLGLSEGEIAEVDSELTRRAAPSVLAQLLNREPGQGSD